MTNFVALLIGLAMFQSASAGIIDVVARESCNEIRLSKEWSVPGGRKLVSLGFPPFNTLNKNSIAHVRFGQKSAITFHFVGKSAASVYDDQSFDFASANLIDGNSGALIGRFLGLTRLDPNAKWFPDLIVRPTASQQILLGVLYVNSSTALEKDVSCEYREQGPLNLPASKCLWIDQFSHEADGKPYCW